MLTAALATFQGRRRGSGAGLGARDGQRRRRGVHAGDVQATAGEQARECAGAAPHVQDAARPEFGSHRGVAVQVAAVRIERVVEPGQTGVIEERIRHAAQPTGREPAVATDFRRGGTRPPRPPGPGRAGAGLPLPYLRNLFQ
jgi:hypothetical protein